jgi:tetratricopeptide (TPR) repeat protein
MSKRISIKDLKSPDKILKLLVRFFKYLKNNVKVLLYIAGGIIILALVFTTLNYMKELRHKKANEILFSYNKTHSNVTNETKEFEKIVNKMPSSSVKDYAIYELAERFYNNKNFEKATYYYNLLIDNSNKLLKIKTLIGLSYSMQAKKDYKEAITILNKALKVNEPSHKALINFLIANNYYKLKDKNKTLEFCNVILMKYPETIYSKMAASLKDGLYEN